MSMHINIIIIIILNIELISSARYYVDSGNRNNNGDGSDWNNAFIDLSDALSIAIEIGDEIWIKEGIYKPSQESERDSCFFVNNGISIYGGFEGIESFINERPNILTTYETIVSGEIRDDTSILDNCYHVLTYNKSILINGITISDGYANNNPNERIDQLPILLHGYGAAMITNNGLDDQQQDINIQNVIFENNIAFNGGALWFGSSYNNNVQVTIRNSLFRNNIAINGEYEGGYGGALYMYYLANINIFQTIFLNNYAEFRGGAIYIDYGAKLDCEECDFENNRATGYGGAVFVQNRQSKNGTEPIFVESLFINNTAQIFGGGMVLIDSIAIVSGVTFRENTADYGGGYALFNSELTARPNTNNNNARLDSSTADEYFEDEVIYTSIDITLQLDVLSQLDELYNLYSRKGDEIDLFPFNPNNRLCYVDGDKANSDNQDGTSWTLAYNDLQECLDTLEISGGEIWVKSATNPYLPTLIPLFKQENGLNRVIDQSFIIYPNIKIYGGFSGDEQTREQRNFADHPTILSGDLGSNNGKVNNIIIIYSNTLIDGFIITNAGCNDNINGNNEGAGIRSFDNSDFSIVNTIFLELCASVGGGIYCQGPSFPTIFNTAFLGNTAGFYGGAIYGTNECDFICHWCTFDSNSVSKIGGAVYLTYDSDVYFESSHFRNNYALQDGGCVGIEQESNVTFDCGKFYNNSARWEGGCLYSGIGSFIQYPQNEQGFIIYGNENTFIDNYLFNNGTYDRGQYDIYLWPYSYTEFYPSDCGAPCEPHCPPPVPRPTASPVQPSIICNGPPKTGIWRESGLIFEFNLDIIDVDRVIFQSCNSEIDTKLELYIYPSIDKIGEDDNSCINSQNAELTMSKLEPGKYFIAMDSSSPEGGIYYLRVLCQTTEPTVSPITLRPTRPPQVVVIPTIPPTDEPTPIPQTPPPSEPLETHCLESHSGRYLGIDLEFRFVLSFNAIVKFRACDSNFDTKLTLTTLNGIIIRQCNDCGTSPFFGGDCAIDSPQCCLGNQAQDGKQSELTVPALNSSEYILILEANTPFTIPNPQ